VVFGGVVCGVGVYFVVCLSWVVRFVFVGGVVSFSPGCGVSVGL